ncbi:acyl--CoA ligase [Paeniglutamicibacter sp. ZC-3]|uniref:class I adenylate-forming enzyme family protein n=1 Tax=Paeniglutamicibacter sp. ZC-3 TaxID=2986919 RepID=UPI0021F72D22|nr:class I adenylate-forming enzyme family protein [Paeniglutamicibacter sp. ZC-3]MCV9994310.1 acyl--CoA ligase [Paeniglutamicibacter sp. ZC-3]
MARQTSARGESPAFSDTRRSTTYREVETRTRRLAGHLAASGLDRQDRILMFLDNAVEVVEAYLAAPIGGFVTVCANPQSSDPEIAYIVKDCSPRVILTDTNHLPQLLPILGQTPTISLVILAGAQIEAAMPDVPGVRFVSYDAWMEQEPAERELTPAAPDDWCWMLYTSGTTGKPKGVRLTQRGCLWVAASCWIPVTELGPADSMLCALPLFHSYALVLCVISTIASGANCIIRPKFSRAEVSDLLGDGVVTFFPGVPTMFHYLLKGAETPRLKAPNLRLCVSAGASMIPALNQEFETFAGVPLLDGYGITETSTMVTLNSPHTKRMPGSCGTPINGVELRIVDPATEEDSPEGGSGELWVRGPNVMLGYHNRPEADAQVLRDGWYRTGDLARRDSEGFVYITGRIKEMIIRGGENIYPAEIEAVLFECEGVADAAVVGVAHEALGEVPVAFIVASESGPLDSEQIIAACRERLSAYKVPSEIIQVSGIPRTGSGKIQRYKLSKPTPLSA